MKQLVFTKGYNFPIQHRASAVIQKAPDSTFIGLSFRDFAHISFKVLVKENDNISLSQALAYPKKYANINFCSPASGIISAINYGPKRVLESIVIKTNNLFHQSNNCLSVAEINNFASQKVQDFLLTQGYWHLFKTFPKKEFAPLDLSLIKAVHINAYQNEPFYPATKLILQDKQEYLKAGITALSKMINNINIYTIKDDNSYYQDCLDKCSLVNIKQQYPAELLGVQAFYSDKLTESQCAIGIDLPSVIDIGQHLLTGVRATERIYSLSGNGIKTPHHVIAKIGSSVADITANNLKESSKLRFIIGGILQGKKVNQEDFLMLKDNAIQVFIEDEKRVPLSFLRLGLDKITLSKTWLSYWLTKEQEMSTNNNGEERACISCGYCIDVCPVKLLPNLLMKASIISDATKLQELSANDCVDCGLCTFVCPSKIEVLEHINKGREMMIKEGYYAV